MANQTGPKRSKIQKEKDLKLVSNLYVKGMSIRDIAKEVSSKRTYSISKSVIQKDIKSLISQWQKECIKNIDHQKSIELKKINKIEVEAWKAFETMSAFRSEGDARSAKFLEIVLKCIEKRCRIFGIDQPVETVLQRQIVVVNLPAVDGVESDFEFSNFETLENE